MQNDDGRENGSCPGGPGEGDATPDGSRAPSAVAHGPEAGGNVLRFPKNWFGSTEDLVPIGSRSVADARPGDSVVQLPSPQITSADDFWSESSVAVHAAVEPPASDPHSDGGRARLLGRIRRRRGAALGLAFALLLASVGLAVPLLPSPSAYKTPQRPRASRLAASSAPFARIAIRPRPSRVAPRSDRQPTIRTHRRPRPKPSRRPPAAVTRRPSGLATTTTPAPTATPTAYRSPRSADAAAADRTTYHRSQPAGPTGPISLIGPGTTPSG